jgi:uncharacterized protein CXXCG
MGYWVLTSTAGSPLEASHRWYMPGVDCTVCGRVWGAGGLSLPTVNLEGNPAEGRLSKEPYPERLPVWQELAAHIRPAIPPDERVAPGLELGPLKGRSIHPFRMTWYLSSMVISEELRDELAALAPEIPLVRAEITGPKLPPCYELEIRSHGAALIEEVTYRCQGCGYTNRVARRSQEDYCIRNVPQVPLFTLQNSSLTIAHDRLIPFLERELGPKLKILPIQVEM